MANVPRPPFQKQPVFVVQQPPPQKRRRFRWQIVVLPAAGAVGLWVFGTISVVAAWSALLSAMKIHDRDAFTHLFLAGLAVTGVVLLAKWLKST
jgi:hypothetical protein